MVDVADVVAVVVAVAVVQALAVTGVVGEAALVGDVVLVVLVVVVAGRQGSGTQVAVPPGVAVVVGAAVLVEAVLVEAVLVGTQVGVVPVLVLVLVLVVGVVVVVVGCGTWVVAGIDDVGAGATGGSAGLLSEALVARGAGRPDAGRAGFCASLAVRDTTLETLAGARSTAGSAVTP